MDTKEGIACGLTNEVLELVLVVDVTFESWKSSSASLAYSRNSMVDVGFFLSNLKLYSRFRFI